MNPLLASLLQLAFGFAVVGLVALCAISIDRAMAKRRSSR